MSIRQVFIAAVIVVVGVAGGSAAAATIDAPMAAGHSAGLSAATIPTGFQAEYVPITPCRYLDTRSQGGAFGNGTSRNYPRRCGIPPYATSLAVSISAVTPTANGYLQAGLTSGNVTTVVNYTRAQSITTGTQLQVNASGIRLVNRGGRTHITLDALGYYQPPMYAYIGFDGNTPVLFAGQRVVSVTGSFGDTDVTFDRDVGNCDLQATSFGYSAVILGVRGTGSVVKVSEWDAASQTAINANFYLKVTC